MPLRPSGPWVSGNPRRAVRREARTVTRGSPRIDQAGIASADFPRCPMSTPERFVGIDVAKDHLDVVIRPDGTHRRVPNTEDGLAELVALLRPVGPTAVVLEA